MFKFGGKLTLIYVLFFRIFGDIHKLSQKYCRIFGYPAFRFAGSGASLDETYNTVNKSAFFFTCSA
jgi:hypothetical protein